MTKLQMPREDSQMKTKQNIISMIQRNQKKIKSFGIKRIALFGSFVRNEQHNESDIDLIVEFIKEEKTFDNFIQLSFFMEELLGQKVELLTPEAISQYIKPYIINEAEYVDFDQM